jgi:DNA-binding IclR family transcriptional regulator
MKKETRSIIKRKQLNKRIYLYIIDYLAATGKMPTLKEIGDAFGFSKERARQKMEQLQEEGYLIKVGRKWRKTHVLTTEAIKNLIQK